MSFSALVHLAHPRRVKGKTEAADLEQSLERAKRLEKMLVDEAL